MHVMPASDGARGSGSPDQPTATPRRKVRATGPRYVPVHADSPRRVEICAPLRAPPEQIRQRGVELGEPELEARLGEHLRPRATPGESERRISTEKDRTHLEHRCRRGRCGRAVQCVPQ